MECKNILNEFFVENKIFLSKRKRLFVILGSFADFDSFEYAQELSSQVGRLSENSIDFIIIGIGSKKSKESFCRFTKLNVQNVISVSNADLHRKLNLNTGLFWPIPAALNLLIMCAGVNSRGTIKEVLRGYLGDNTGHKIFSSDENIKLGQFSLLKGKMFNIFSDKNVLRPFELATRRLINMIEILSNWNTYVPDISFLTQRGATILISEKDELLYIYKPESLLGYSSSMNNPLSFLDDFIN